MLFSESRIAEFINANFEPVWQSVAPVPIVTVDFGNGHSIKRTFRGNIATHIIDSEQHVIDVIPGLLQPTTYTRLLTKALAVHAEVRESGTDADKLAKIQDYHRKALSMSINSTKQRLAQDVGAFTDSAPLTSEDLYRDTLLNETKRHPNIHTKLSSSALVTPNAITPWIFEDILQVRLSDPHLGYSHLLMDQPVTAQDPE